MKKETKPPVVIENFENQFAIYNEAGQMVDADFDTYEEAKAWVEDNGYKLVQTFNLSTPPVREGMPEGLEAITFGQAFVAIFQTPRISSENGKITDSQRSVLQINHFDPPQRIFNEAIAAEICKRYNAFQNLVELLGRVQEMAVHIEGDLEGNKARTGIFKHINQAPQLYTDIRNLLDKL